MRIKDKPKVYLISRPSIVEEGIQQFLEDEGLRWPTETEGVSGAERLVELAGRCCFDDKTEVCTSEGWKLFKNLNREEKIFTLDPKTLTGCWQTPHKYQEYNLSKNGEELFVTDGRDISFGVTSEHRLFGRFENKNFGFVKASNIGKKIFKILVSCKNWVGYYPSEVEIPNIYSKQKISNQYGNYGEKKIVCKGHLFSNGDKIFDLAKLIVYYATEGSLKQNDKSGHGIVIYGDHQKKVEEICDRLKFPYSRWVDERNNCPRTIVGGGKAIGNYFELVVGKRSHNKKLPEWILNLPKKELESIWKILVETDGHAYPNDREVLITTSLKLAGQAQEILCKIGFGSSILFESEGVNYPVFRVSRKKNNEVLINKNTFLEKMVYKGKVYCVSTENGIVLVRRNGKPHFSGNCYMSFGGKAVSRTNKRYIQNILGRNEDGSFKSGPAHGSVTEHPNWSFLVVGAGRGFSHEQVRHRVGWAYCLSGDTEIFSERFVNGKRNGAKKRKIQDIYAMTKTSHGRSRLRLMKLRCLDEKTGMFTTGKIKKVVQSGLKNIFKITLEDGKTIRCSEDHRFLGKNGWSSIKDLVDLSLTSNGIAVWRKKSSIGVNGVPVYQDYEWLKERYHDSNMLLREISKEANVSTHTIRKWLKHHDLQKNIKEINVGRVPWNKGKKYVGGWKHSSETKENFSLQKQGEKNPMWRGGVSRNSFKIRRGVSLLRPSVLERDDYTCRFCEERGGSLTVHHVIPLWADESLALDKKNLVTLCKKCHFEVNGNELDFVEFFRKKPKNMDNLIQKRKILYSSSSPMKVKYVNISSIEFEGENITYDIEMEGNNKNFVANGIVTHNSQISTRYCDFEREEQEGSWDPGFCIPTLGNLNAQTREKMEEAIVKSRNSYVEILHMIEDDLENNAEFMKNLEGHDDRTAKRMLRKAARGAARDVLPLATESIMTMTANARAIWNCIYLRGSEHAEAVIRDVYVQIARIMEKEMPALFYGLKYEELWDGTTAVSLPREKL